MGRRLPRILSGLCRPRQVSVDELRAWVEVDLGALVRNGRALAARAGVPLMPMVKADAYGLGASAVARALEAIDPWGYGVATIEEGQALREVGIGRPIVVFTPLLAADMAAAHAARLTPAFGQSEAIVAWDQRTGGAPWHLAIDTGMSRSGVRWHAVAGLATVLSAHPPEGACTHFLAADRDDGSLERQVQRFTEALAALPARPAVLHAENSAAVEHLSGRSMWTVARPGIFLYGVTSQPPARRADRPLIAEPVVALRARVVDLRTIEDGSTVSYGGTYRARGRRRIATVAAGYGDGYRRAFSNVGEAYLGGQRVPVVGAVTMDMTMLDATGTACAIGDVATLLGPVPSGADEDTRPGIDLATAADAAGVLPYELLVGLRLRLPRVYVDVPPV
jgi:alanine racemase